MHTLFSEWLFERSTDPERRARIDKAFNALKAFMEDVTRDGTFSEYFEEGDDNFFFRCGKHLPEVFKGNMEFLAHKFDKEAEQTDNPLLGQQINYSGGFNFLDFDPPLFTFVFKTDRKTFMQNFPKYCANWLAQVRQTFNHEYNHYLDWLDSGGKAIPAKNIWNAGAGANQRKKYFNSTHEVNSFFTDMVMDDFEFVRGRMFVGMQPAKKQAVFEKMFGRDAREYATKFWTRKEGFSEFSDETRKRLAKRLYGAYQQLRAESGL